MINFDEWVADISSKYSVAIYEKSSKTVGCVSLQEGLEYAKNLKIPFVCYDTSTNEKKKTCKELNNLVGVVGIVGYPDHTEPL